jgi:hypothetical protein
VSVNVPVLLFEHWKAWYVPEIVVPLRVPTPKNGHVLLGFGVPIIVT